MGSDKAAITVYWRPGCGFCAALLGDLDRTRVPHRRVNIWEDSSAAATVRSVAGGNETVPTVAVGPVALVNPTLDDVLRAAQQHAPHAVPDTWEPPRPGRLTRWLTSKLAGADAAR